LFFIMAALAASTAFKAALESLRVAYLPDGVNNMNYLDFDDRFKGLLTLTGTEEMGIYGLQTNNGACIQGTSFPTTQSGNLSTFQTHQNPSHCSPQKAQPKRCSMPIQQEIALLPNDQHCYSYTMSSMPSSSTTSGSLRQWSQRPAAKAMP
jgi:hypothetical protein